MLRLWLGLLHHAPQKPAILCTLLFLAQCQARPFSAFNLLHSSTGCSGLPCHVSLCSAMPSHLALLVQGLEACAACRRTCWRLPP